MTIDIKKIKEQAVKEHKEEKEKIAVIKLKNKLLELDKAKKIVSNIEREIEDLEDELANE